MNDFINLHDLLGDIDKEIHQLFMKRQKIIKDIATVEECSDMNYRAIIFADIIKCISTITEPTSSLYNTNMHLQPFMHKLPKKFFENLHETWAFGLPSNWTSAEAVAFFARLSSALERDVAAIEVITGSVIDH
jgi:hypothetical protein